MLVEEVLEWQPTMFQPIGGMDRIPYAFASRLDSVIRYGAEVTRIRQSDSGVTVTYTDSSGAAQIIESDYCICAMPLTIARTLDADFSAPIRAILDNVQYDSAYKIAWEAPRFWEKETNIFGGISYLQQDRRSGLVSQRALLFGERHRHRRLLHRRTARRSARFPICSEKTELSLRDSTVDGYAFGHLPSMQAKLDASRRSIDLLHPGHGKDLSKPIYISWGKIPHNLGSWISLAWNDDKALARRCNRPIGGSTSPATTPAASSAGRKGPRSLRIG